MGLGSVRGRQHILAPKVKERVLGICVLNDTFVLVLVLLITPILRCFWLNLHSLDILGRFCDHCFLRYDSALYGYVLKLQDIFDFQGQVLKLLNFLFLFFGKIMGQGICYIYYKRCCIFSINEHYIRSVEI